MKKTSEQWKRQLPYEVTVYDPDGWDRMNLDESWAELITEQEFTKRLMVSTLVCGELKWWVCPECGGNKRLFACGENFESGSVVCHRCKGTGKKPLEDRMLVFKRKKFESWKHAGLRYAKKYEMEADFRREYKKHRAEGEKRKYAAFYALEDWDLLDGTA